MQAHAAGARLLSGQQLARSERAQLGWRAARVAARRPHGRPAPTSAVLLDRVPDVASPPPSPSSSEPADPWNDPKWTGYKWTVYRGVAYDLTSYINKHPAGSWLIGLAVGRDCTALVESYHMRPEVTAAHMQRLPVLEGFPVEAVPRAPRPNDSGLYNRIRERVREVVFKGEERNGAHRTGSDAAALAVLSYTALSYAGFAAAPNALTGCLYGLACAWVGLTIQHCGNHGAMSNSPLINNLLGLTADLVGGSSLVWRYHHGVSHHVHCNDGGLDEDVFSAYPLLRFDARLPRKWWHQYQHIYMWAAFPLLMVGWQLGDFATLASNRTHGATMYGATDAERGLLLLGKAAYYGLLLGLPIALHGVTGDHAAGVAACLATHSIVLSTTFAVSHNVDEAKPLGGGVPEALLYGQELPGRDWGVQQVVTSANWGDRVGNFFTGGLNLQVEHHLFPAVAFEHYPAISRVVKEVCQEEGVPYAHYATLPEIMGRFVGYMKEVGAAEQVALGESDQEAAAALARL